MGKAFLSRNDKSFEDELGYEYCNTTMDHQSQSSRRQNIIMAETLRSCCPTSKTIALGSMAW